MHLFLHCNVFNNIWAKVIRGLDFAFITPPNLFVFGNVGVRKVESRGSIEVYG